MSSGSWSLSLAAWGSERRGWARDMFCSQPSQTHSDGIQESSGINITGYQKLNVTWRVLRFCMGKSSRRRHRSKLGNNRLYSSLDGEHCVKHVVPNFARDTEAQLEVFVVVGKMILLHLTHIRRQTGVVEPKEKVSTWIASSVHWRLTHSACSRIGHLTQNNVSGIKLYRQWSTYRICMHQ